MKYTPFFLIFAVCFTVFFACEPSEKDEPSLAAGFSSEMLAQVNELRRNGCRCGNTFYPPVEPLRWNKLLADAAQQHSSDMHSNNFFEHLGSEGSTSGDRVTAAGYRWRAVGENIAEGYTTIDGVVQGWLESEGHCKNLMDSNFTEMGAARQGNLWTQTFAAPL